MVAAFQGDKPVGKLALPAVKLYEPRFIARQRQDRRQFLQRLHGFVLEPLAILPQCIGHGGQLVFDLAALGHFVLGQFLRAVLEPLEGVRHTFQFGCQNFVDLERLLVGCQLCDRLGLLPHPLGQLFEFLARGRAGLCAFGRLTDLLLEFFNLVGKRLDPPARLLILRHQHFHAVARLPDTVEIGL